MLYCRCNMKFQSKQLTEIDHCSARHIHFPVLSQLLAILPRNMIVVIFFIQTRVLVSQVCYILHSVSFVLVRRMSQNYRAF